MSAANLFDSGERKTLAEMKAANLPHCTPWDLGVSFSVNSGVPEAERAAAEAAMKDATAGLAAYLLAFTAPGPCIQCGATLGGNKDNMLGAVLGTFTWGLAHGEGRCGRCGYPARGLHHVALGDAGELTLPYILQYHPDSLSDHSEPTRPVNAPSTAGVLP